MSHKQHTRVDKSQIPQIKPDGADSRENWTAGTKCFSRGKISNEKAINNKRDLSPRRVVPTFTQFTTPFLNNWNFGTHCLLLLNHRA